MNFIHFEGIESIPSNCAEIHKAAPLWLTPHTPHRTYYDQGSLYQDSRARLLRQQLMEVMVVLQEVGQAAAR